MPENWFFNLWKKAYDSKAGKALRWAYYGNDSDLTDEEYLAKHGYKRPGLDFGPPFNKPTGILANAASSEKAMVGASRMNRAVSSGPKEKRPRITKKNYEKVRSNRLDEKIRADRAQQMAEEAKAYEIKDAQINVARDLQRLADEKGINTPAWQRKAMMRAVEIDPKTTTPPPEGSVYVAPYQTGYRNGEPLMFEGEPLLDWFDATNRTFGPHSKVLQAEKPLIAASNYYKTVGPVMQDFGAHSELAPSPTNRAMLRDGLDNLVELFFKKHGGTLYAKSGIHIKKENRGKFTSYCGGKVTNECIQRGKHSSNPAIRKRATFAANARKWKHKYGGKIVPIWIYNMLTNEKE